MQKQMMKMRTRMMIGKQHTIELPGEVYNCLLPAMFSAQSAYQKQVTGLQTPIDDVEWYIYHMAAMQEELGEILKADKRWKTHRNVAYDPQNKLEEIADVFITAMNIALYSGFDGIEVAERIVAKIAENTEKLRRAQNVQGKGE